MTQTVHPQSRPRRHPPGGRRVAHGFTIAEMAVVVVIMAVVMTASLKLLGTQIDNAALKQTRDKHAAIEQALIWHLRTFGHLPCPDTNFSPAPATGSATVPCPSGYGVVPWITLGLPRDAAIDGWGNFISYRVATGPASGTTTDWTAPPAPSAIPIPFSINELTTPLNQVLVQERDGAGNLVNVTPQAVVVLVSHGKNSEGAIKPSGTVEIQGGNTDENLNTTAPYTSFLMRTQSLVSWATAGGVGLFDDVVTYMRPQQLLQPLLNERTLLGVCQAYCATPGPGCAPGPGLIPVGRTPPACP